ncbi:MAG: hypothetical protein AAFZ52_09105, partial [Bacteroidota bacterium]
STIATAQEHTMRPGAAAPGLPRYALRKASRRPAGKLYQTFKLPSVAPEEAVGRLQLTGLPDSLRAVVLGLPRLDAFYRLAEGNAHTIAVGTYDLLYHFRNDSVFHRRVTVTRDSLLLLHYDRAEVTYYDQYSALLGYRETRPWQGRSRNRA